MNAAVYNTTPDITHVILQHGGNVTLSDDDGRTAVMLACCNSDQHLPVLQALMGHHTGALVQLEERNSDGWTAVMCAVASNSPGCLRLLLDMGARIYYGRYSNGQSVMGWARKLHYTEVIRVLEEHSRTGELLVQFCFINVCMYLSLNIKGRIQTIHGPFYERTGDYARQRETTLGKPNITSVLNH